MDSLTQVIDWGSYSIKAGIAGYDHCAHIHVPDSPVFEGKVNDWNAVQETLLSPEFKSAAGYAGYDDPDQALLWIDSPAASDRGKATEMAFEALDMSAFYVISSSILSLYQTGRTSGLILECGHSYSSASFAYEGYLLPHTENMYITGGLNVTQYLSNQLGIDCQLADQVKQDCALVSDDPLRDLGPSLEGQPKQSDASFKLPDGSTLIVPAHVRLRSGEIVFQPTCFVPHCKQVASLQDLAVGRLKGWRTDATLPPWLKRVCEQGRERGLGVLPSPGESIVRSWRLCDDEVRTMLGATKDCVISGGTCDMPGFADRLQKEIKQFEPTIHVVKSQGPAVDAAWMGGSVLGSLCTFGSMWISKGQYDEAGPSIVKRKCF